MSKKDVDKKPEAESQVPSTHVNYGDDEGQGFENQTQEDYSLPFLNLLQPLSPEVEKDDGKFIKGAEPGMFINPVTQALYPGDGGVLFVPCMTKHVYVEWVPRDSGGGFVAVYEMTDPKVAEAKRSAAESNKKFGKLSIGDNDLVETFYIYGVTYQGDKPGEIVVIGFTSTKIKAYKDYNTRMNTCTVPNGSGGKTRPPIFAHRIKLTSYKTKKDKHTFWNVKFEPAVNGSLFDSLLNPANPDHLPVFLFAKEARELVASGKAEANYATQDHAASESEETDGTTAKKAPF